MSQHCKALDLSRAEAFIRDEMRFKPVSLFASAQDRTIVGRDGTTYRFTYLGFITVLADGMSLQRPTLVSDFYTQAGHTACPG